MKHLNGSQYPLWYPQYISGYERVRITTTTQMTMMEMEPLTRQQFHFAASSFSRIYGVSHVSSDMIDFCYDWAFTEEKAPLDCLNHVDRYFRQLWTESQN